MSTPGLLDRAGQIKGTDFSHFYVLGRIALNDNGAILYDPDAFRVFSARVLPDPSGTYYLPTYAPQVSLLFAPLAIAPYEVALALWLLTSSVIYGLCCWLVWRTCGQLRGEGRLVLIVAAGNPAFIQLLAHGQNSAIVLACVTAAFFALKQNRRFLAGLAIGCLAFKPQLGIVAAFVFLLNREWRVVAGAVVAAVAQFGVAWLTYGSNVMVEYWEWVGRIGEFAHLLQAKPHQMHSLSAFWSLLLPSDTAAMILYGVCAILAVLIACWVWRSPTPLALRYSVLLLATVLVSPHLNVYDLIILTPAVMMTADWTLSVPHDPLAKRVQQTIYFSYALPLVGAATQFTRVQLSVIAMSSLLTLLGIVLLRHPEHGRFSALHAESDVAAGVCR